MLALYYLPVAIYHFRCYALRTARNVRSLSKFKLLSCQSLALRRVVYDMLGCVCIGDGKAHAYQFEH